MDNIITFVSFCSSVKIVLFSSYQQQPQLVSCYKICTDIKARFSKLPKKKKPIAIRFLFLYKPKEKPKEKPQKTNHKMNLPIHFIQ